MTLRELAGADGVGARERVQLCVQRGAVGSAEGDVDAS